MKEVKLLEKISNAFGVSGFEDEVVEVVEKEMNFIKDYSLDRMNNLRYKKEGKGISYILDAHIDEVGFMIKDLNDNGTMNIMQLGRWVESNIPAHKWIIKNLYGEKITAVSASKPPHFMSEADYNKPLNMDDILLDVGAGSKEELIEMGLDIGLGVVPDVKLSYDKKNDLLIGKGFDCRIGVTALVLTAKYFRDKPTDAELNYIFSAQEEVGIRGAEVNAKNVKADFAIVFEGCPADDTFGRGYTTIGKGPMLRFVDAGMITHPKFQRHALNIAKQNNIPVQSQVRTGGATNGKAYHLSKYAIPSIVIGIPVRYIHSHYGMSKLEDLKNAVKLAVKIIELPNPL